MSPPQLPLPETFLPSGEDLEYLSSLLLHLQGNKKETGTKLIKHCNARVKTQIFMLATITIVRYCNYILLQVGTTERRKTLAFLTVQYSLLVFHTLLLMYMCLCFTAFSLLAEYTRHFSVQVYQSENEHTSHSQLLQEPADLPEHVQFFFHEPPPWGRERDTEHPLANKTAAQAY